MQSKWIAVGLSVFSLAAPASALAGENGGGSVGSGGPGQAQSSNQLAVTLQAALSQAKAEQNAVNSNSPVNTAGRDIYGGDNSATQNASNKATSQASNWANTSQNNNQSQNSGSGKKQNKYSDPPSYGNGGSGQAASSSQIAATLQLSLSQAQAKQNAVNGNTPVNTAGGSVYGGSNSAKQTRTTRRPAARPTRAAPSRTTVSPSPPAPATESGTAARARPRAATRAP
jgi:hypothetical protein